MTVERVDPDATVPIDDLPRCLDRASLARDAPGPVVLDLIGGPVIDLRDERGHGPMEWRDDLREPSAACRYRAGRLAVKWLLDRVLGVVALILAVPLIIVVAVAVRVSSRGPVLFAQTRVGRWGRPFTIYKFRTMRVDAEEVLARDPDLADRHRRNDFKLAIVDDARVTRVGRILRKTSLDELPQLVNIIKGDMSFVGPRPVVPAELEEYGRYRPMYEAAFPGLTGAWQVAGRDNIKYPARAALDADYVERWTLWGDLVIMARTIPALLDPRRTR